MKQNGNIFQIVRAKTQLFLRALLGVHNEAENQPDLCITHDSFYPFFQNLPPHFEEYTMYSYSESCNRMFAVAQDCIKNLFGEFFIVFHIIASDSESEKHKHSIFTQYRDVFSGFETVFSNQRETALIIICKETDALTKILANELDGTFYFYAYAYESKPQIASFAQAIQFFEEYNFVGCLSYIKWPDDITFSVDLQRMQKSSIISAATVACEKHGESLVNEIS